MSNNHISTEGVNPAVQIEIRAISITLMSLIHLPAKPDGINRPQHLDGATAALKKEKQHPLPQYTQETHNADNLSNRLTMTTTENPHSTESFEQTDQ